MRVWLGSRKTASWADRVRRHIRALSDKSSVVNDAAGRPVIMIGVAESVARPGKGHVAACRTNTSSSVMLRTVRSRLNGRMSPTVAQAFKVWLHAVCPLYPVPGNSRSAVAGSDLSTRMCFCVGHVVMDWNKPALEVQADAFRSRKKRPRPSYTHVGRCLAYRVWLICLPRPQWTMIGISRRLLSNTSNAVVGPLVTHELTTSCGPAETDRQRHKNAWSGYSCLLCGVLEFVARLARCPAAKRQAERLQV